MKIRKILNIIAGIIKRACVIFTFAILAVNLVGNRIFAFETFEYDRIYITFLFALIMAVLIMVYKIELLPKYIRHILFFLLFYASFMFVYIPGVMTSISSRSSIYLTFIFALVYAVCFTVWVALKKLYYKLSRSEEE